MPLKADTATGGTIHVEAYSRLHFGLLEIHPGAPHCFGGIGLMVDRPSVRLSACPMGLGASPVASDPCVDWQDPYWKERFEKVYQRYRLRTGGQFARSVQLQLAPSPHIGLGSGTQFACAASAILNAKIGFHDERSKMHDASVTIDSGRGLRSHIGLNGFLSGQMLVDRGEPATGGAWSTPRTQVASFPESWRLVLLYEDVYQGDFGDTEQSIFDACSKNENVHRQQMMKLIEHQILPSVGRSDFDQASHSIGMYGELAGGIFAPALGDAYRSPRIRYWVDRFRSMGFYGTGQSSWGPVVFVIVQDEPQARWLTDKVQSDLLPGGWIDVTKVAGPAKIHAAG